MGNENVDDIHNQLITKNVCPNETRVAVLEQQQKNIYRELNKYQDALMENTRAISRLNEILASHEVELAIRNNKSNSYQSVITGVIVGVVVFLATGLINLL